VSASVAAPQGSDGSLSLRCDGCGAQIQVAAGLRTAKCPYCASPAVVERPADPSRPDPTFALGFIVTKERALAQARAWIKKPLFAPSAFRSAHPSDVRGLYLPAYLYSAVASADYDAEIGENYTVVETYTTTDSKGNPVTRTRTKTKTEWRHLSGRWAAYVDDVLVTASAGLPNNELERVEPFDMRTLQRFSPKLLSGWIAEDPSLGRDHCLSQARVEAEAAIGRRIAAYLPGDSHRGLSFRWLAQHEDMQLLLLPVWVFAVKYAADKPPVRLVVNGQTGVVGGKAPLSWAKIVIAIVLGLAIILAAVLLGGMK
jgi:DNA-directed RNA polymerase subunit RPC12/RpoP